MVTADSLIRMIEEAFKDRVRPGDEDITHCSYDAKYGGKYDGPCWDCAEMDDYFQGRSWRDLTAVELFRNGQTEALFTPEAYCYFLPAYLIAAVRNPNELDVCVDHLAYRFGPERTEQWSATFLSAVLTLLSDREVEVILAYFLFARDRDMEFDSVSSFCEQSIQKLQQELSQRTNGRKQPAS